MTLRIILSLASVFLIISPPTLLLAADWYVDDSVWLPGDGSSWQKAFKTIQWGIDKAENGDKVMVGEGTYNENIDFKGKNIVIQSRDPLDARTVERTIINGGQAGSVVTFAGTENETCSLLGFTIRNGKATYGGGICGGTAGGATGATIEYNVITSNSADFGGGMRCCDGSVQYNIIKNNSAVGGGGLDLCNGVIDSNTIRDNAATEGGGLRNCDGQIGYNTIQGNVASEDGGGLHGCNGGKVANTISDNVSNRDGGGLYSCGGTIRINTISGNSADRNGGGLCDCDVLILENTITGNLAVERGGGLYGCDGTIRDNEISDNSVTEEIGTGGGLGDCDGDILTNDILGNTAPLGGGGLHGCDGSIQSNTISGNWCTTRDSGGGGLYECEAPISHNHISENLADFGGGVYRCHISVYSNVISLNSATEDGGGISDCDGTIFRNYITGNTAANGGGISHCSGTIQNNVIRDNTAGIRGGGLQNLYASSIVRNNLIVGNSSEKGGGLDRCRGEIVNNTIVDNSELLYGGGLYQCTGTIQNCVIWGNKGCVDCDAQLYECSEPVYCCIENWAGGSAGNNTGKSPIFWDIDGLDNDRHTHEDNDYRVAPGSSCIDAGENEDWMWYTVDLDQNLRIFPGDSSVRVDMGAYEFIPQLAGTTLFIAAEETGIRLFWNSAPGNEYSIWSCLDLVADSWTHEETLLSQSRSATWTDPFDTTPTRKFYRIGIE